MLIKYPIPAAEETMELPGAGCLAAFAALGKEQGPARNAAEARYRTMYREYYRLQEEPFTITPDPRYLSLTEQHREAMNHLLYGIRRRKGFICLTGEVGAGKTTLCRALLKELGDTCRTALILNPMLTETRMIRAIVEEFGIRTNRKDRLGYLQLLNEFLLRINSYGQDAVLIRHRLKVAGQDDSDHNAVRFDYGAVREIFRYPNGTPRMISAISDKALLAGYVYRTTTIDRGIVQVALNELKEAS